MCNIIDIVKFNNGHAYVLDENYSLTYKKYGEGQSSLLIGSDDTQTFFRVLYYSPCGGDRTFGGNYAFGGREFDIPMKDGTKTHCYGQYWDGEYRKAEKILGVEFANFTHDSLSSLKKCYVFSSGTADMGKLNSMIAAFESKNPDYEPWDYWEYEKHIKGESDNG